MNVTYTESKFAGSNASPDVTTIELEPREMDDFAELGVLRRSNSALDKIDGSAVPMDQVASRQSLIEEIGDHGRLLAAVGLLQASGDMHLQNAATNVTADDGFRIDFNAFGIQGSSLTNELLNTRLLSVYKGVSYQKRDSQWQGAEAVQLGGSLIVLAEGLQAVSDSTTWDVFRSESAVSEFVTYAMDRELPSGSKVLPFGFDSLRVGITAAKDRRVHDLARLSEVSVTTSRLMGNHRTVSASSLTIRALPREQSDNVYKMVLVGNTSLLNIATISNGLPLATNNWALVRSSKPIADAAAVLQQETR